MKATIRSPPLETWGKCRKTAESFLFGLTAHYLSEWDLSRVQSTTPALDQSQADWYSPKS